MKLPAIFFAMLSISAAATCPSSGAPVPGIRTIGLVSISSILPREQFDAGTNELTKAGWRVKVAPNVVGPQIAPATDRARILEEFWLDPEIDLLLFSRGGEGAADVVPLLDWERLRARPDLPVIGFSDVTILLNAMLAKGVGHPLSGPMLSYATRLTPEARDWFLAVIAGAMSETMGEDASRHGIRRELPPIQCRVLRGGAVESALPMGGHVTRMHWLWERGLAPSAAGRVVFLECTARHVAATVIADIEAMRDGGFFDGAAAVVFGSFKHKDAEREAIEAFLPAFAATVKCPVFADFPYGHIFDIRTLDFRRPLSISPAGLLQFAP
ncbi:MAG: LD-carboxypeptidase [Kiritimatiellae bacterium]|nr:LD-carboxypeptidase [Kiritimatiellia bacterium]